MNNCIFCNSLDYDLLYGGNIRDGSNRNFIFGEVYKCKSCDIVRLDEKYCISSSDYESDMYRLNMNQGITSSDFFKVGDPLQIFNLQSFWPLNLRGKKVIDIGTGGGSFLDSIGKIVDKAIAVEPTKIYHNDLKRRGYEVFSYAKDAINKYSNCIDIAFSFQVIEHVSDPVLFIKEAIELLKPGGELVIGTPNHDDILMKLIPDIFKPFNYRTQHRWYFDSSTLKNCVKVASNDEGNAIDVKHIHTFGLSNTFKWLMDREPGGNERLLGIDSNADNLWSTYLQSTGQSDTIFITYRKSL